MRSKFEPILNFIKQGEENTPLLDAGLPTLLPRPIGKDIAELVAKGKVAHVERFANIQSQQEQWDWAKSYLDYLVELEVVQQYNAELPETTQDAEGNEVPNEPKPLPVAPERPAVRTTEEVLSPYMLAIEKLRGVTFKGVNVSLNEANQNGLSALKSALDLAIEFGAEEQFFPVNFNAETSQGVQVLPLDNAKEFKQFGLEFVLSRRRFFE
ncbi:hypothetical protein [Pseudoalteromonas galatheae]|uniref:hypothetical protein n=1 Tax=Pseudoalteromonas galatheae TaxID=579562 RepID=UPI0030CF3792